MIVKCPSCEKKVSNDASTCPLCGFKFESYDFQAIIEKDKVLNVTPAQRPYSQYQQQYQQPYPNIYYAQPKPVKEHKLLEPLCFLSILVLYFLAITPLWPISYIGFLAWLIVYHSMTESEVLLGYDNTKTKQTRNAICVMFIFLFFFSTIIFWI